MNELERNRKKLSKIDKKIIKLLSKRFRITSEIIRWKEVNGIPLEDVKQEQKQDEVFRSYAKKYNLPEDLLIDLYKKIRTAVKQKTGL